MRGETVVRDVTLTEHVDEYLAAHATGRDASTIRTLTHRLGYATATLGDLTLAELERRVPEIAAWVGTLPAGSRYGIVQAFRQALEAAVRWGLMTKNPAKLAGPNPQPKAEEIDPFTQAEIDLVAEELGPSTAPPSCSRPRPECAPRSGSLSSSATSIAGPVWWSWSGRARTASRRATGRPPGAAVEFRCRRGRWRRSTRRRGGSTCGSCSPVGVGE